MGVGEFRGWSITITQRQLDDGTWQASPSFLFVDFTAGPFSAIANADEDEPEGRISPRPQRAIELFFSTWRRTIHTDNANVSAMHTSTELKRHAGKRHSFI